MGPGIIADEPKNQETLDRLVKRVRTIPGIVPFVGAGLSIPFGLPGWKSFLKRIVAQFRPNDHKLAAIIHSQLKRGQYEEAAERIIRAINRDLFDRTVASAFGDDAVQVPVGTTVMQLLPQIAQGPVVTTNFDHVLETVFREARRAFDLVLWGPKIQTASDVLAEDLHLLLKLHGDALDTEDRILTRQEYRESYGSSDPERVDLRKPLPQLLERLFRTRSVLFLGCSLQGDRYMRLLRRIGADDSAPECFAVVEAPSSAAAMEKRERFLRAHHLTPLWIPAYRWDALAPLLAFLGNAAAQIPRRRRAVRIPLSLDVPPLRQVAQDARERARVHAQRDRLHKRWDRLQSDQQKVRFLRQYGEALYQAGFYRDYIDLAIEAVESAKQLGQSCDEAEFFYNMHLAWRALGGSRNESRANACLRRAERMLQDYPLSNLKGKIIHDKAHLLAARGLLHEAAADYRNAAQFAQRVGDHRIGTTWVQLGRVLGQLGDRQAPARYARRAIAYSAQHGEGEEEARAWLALADAHADNGHARLALNAQKKAVALLQTKGDQRTLARAINDLGAAYYQDGKTHRALECFLRAIWWDQQIDNRPGVASGLSNVAWLHWEVATQKTGLDEASGISSLQRSSEYFSQALAVQRTLGHKLEVARLLAYRSIVLSGLGNEPDALSDIHSALPRLRASRDWTSLAVAFNNRGIIQEKLGLDKAAVRSFRSALRHADRGPEIAIRQTVRGNMLPLLRRLGRAVEAGRVKRELRSLGASAQKQGK